VAPHTPDAEIMHEEIFSPVVIVNSFKSEEEVIALANDTEYGLMAGVFTQDINRAMKVASLLESESVGVNCISRNSISTPFGGSKHGGLGKENGREALEAYTEKKVIMINLTY
jgi:aldehyde dehydrogenase (NAD+)